MKTSTKVLSSVLSAYAIGVLAYGFFAFQYNFEAVFQPWNGSFAYTVSFLLHLILFVISIGLVTTIWLENVKISKFLAIVAPAIWFLYNVSVIVWIIRLSTSDSLSFDLVRRIFIGDTGYVLSIFVGIILLICLLSNLILVTLKKESTIKAQGDLKFGDKEFHFHQASTASKENQLGAIMSNGQDINPPGAQWKVKIPGQPDQAVDTATLQMWARSGIIKADTLVVDVANNMTYSADQIPRVFSSKSYVTALLLSFFIGFLGIDRFYLGQAGLGIGKLLTGGGCGIWWLIDFILIAMRKVKDSQGNPLA